MQVYPLVIHKQFTVHPLSSYPQPELLYPFVNYALVARGDGRS